MLFSNCNNENEYISVDIQCTSGKNVNAIEDREVHLNVGVKVWLDYARMYSGLLCFY